jgi:hypothetical protein
LGRSFLSKQKNVQNIAPPALKRRTPSQAGFENAGTWRIGAQANKAPSIRCVFSRSESVRWEGVPAEVQAGRISNSESVRWEEVPAEGRAGENPGIENVRWEEIPTENCSKGNVLKKIQENRKTTCTT